ncbi:MAG: hypothetical protein V4454_15605 [Pseudomonadota bacterium]
MNVSRPVIAFALLRHSSDLIKTDLLGGVCLLIRPLIADLAGHVYDASELARRMASSYGISLPAGALEEFLPRLIAGGVLVEQKSPGGFVKAVYSEQTEIHVELGEEKEFQDIIDDFLLHCEPLLKAANISVEPQKLTAGFLTHLSTLDFSDVRVRPTAAAKPAQTIQGPAAVEKIVLSKELAEGAAIDVLVASYVSKLQETNPSRLILLSHVADGALGAELVLDLQAPSKVPRLSNTTVILDTPIILSYLDLSSKQEFEAAKIFVAQLLGAGVKIAAFRHSIEEAEGVLSAIQMARHTGADAYGPSIPRLANSVYRAYFDSMKNNVGIKWTSKFEVIQETAGHYYKNFTAEDEELLTHEIKRSLLDRLITRERDAKSVAETLRRLGGAHIPVGQIDSCKYIFITPNRPLQEKIATFLKRKDFVRSGEFTPVVTDRYMAGLCWLITGGTSANSPTVARLLANCAAALRLRPELAERTKKFLAELDPEKALHFEALMTNERASQYLMEVTFGNPDALTALGAEGIFEEAQRRAAEKVAKEKDDFYLNQISELQTKILESSSGSEELQEKLAVISLEAQARASDADAAAKEVERLRTETVEKQSDITLHTQRNSELAASISTLEKKAEKSVAELSRHGIAAKRSAEKYAQRRYSVVRVLGAVGVFLCSLGLGYADKFWLSTLTLEHQKFGNAALIAIQAALAVFGLSILADKFVTSPLRRWRDRLYEERMLELGYSDSLNNDQA